MMGGQVGIADHVTVGAGAMLGAQSGYMSDVPAGARWIGSPAQPVRDFMKGVAVLRRLARNAGKPEGERGMTGEKPSAAADIHEILRLLPHRYPFLMIDRVIDIRGDDHAHRHQERDRSTSRSFLGHFPGESGHARRADDRRDGADRGRACVCATCRRADRRRAMFFLTIDKAKFRKPAVPGDTLEYHVDKIAPPPQHVVVSR